MTNNAINSYSIRKQDATMLTRFIMKCFSSTVEIKKFLDKYANLNVDNFHQLVGHPVSVKKQFRQFF